MDANLKKILIMAGGTGGHVYPALSVADKLLARHTVVEWLGTRRGIENQLVPERGLPLHFVSISGLRGKGLLRWLVMPWQLSRAVLQALMLIRRIKPDLVLGLGGFASGPGGLAAWLLSKPLVIHEQNAVAGTTNRWLNRLSTRSLQAFPGSLRGAVTVGNPVREDILKIAPFADRRRGETERPRLLVLGGSLGALKLNQVLPEALAKMPADERPEVWHQTGKDHHQLTLNLYQRLQVKARVDAYIDAMHHAYTWADLIICRAGALTVSEVSIVGLAAIFIPYPHAIDDHQSKNARYLVDVNAARVLQENQLSSDTLCKLLKELLTDRQQLQTMAANAREIGTRDAAERVADVCLELAHG
jgi:UDP-N-acetylglucosamine--N-acetylmuramyl-(pentapeptide) pyrophosphoryl-undecaprenol N-acetylglucosamine transferase